MVHLTCFAVIVIGTSMIFEHAASELYEMKRKQAVVIEQKKQFVDFLCNELKMPLQIIVNAIEMTDLSHLSRQGVRAARRMIVSIQEAVRYMTSVPLSFFHHIKVHFTLNCSREL